MTEIDYVRMWKDAVLIYVQASFSISEINTSNILFYEITDYIHANYMRVHAISEDCPYLRHQFYSKQSVTSTFSLTALLLMGDFVQATRPLYQIQNTLKVSKWTRCRTPLPYYVLTSASSYDSITARMEAYHVCVHENRILHFKSCSGFHIITSLANFSFHESNKYKRDYASAQMADSCLPRARSGSKTCRRKEQKADMVN